MKQRVVTLMWGDAWTRYGQRFTESFERHWPADVELVIVTDRELPTKRATQIRLNDVPGYSDFMERWKDDRHANGFRSTRRGHGLRRCSVKAKNWRHDAVGWAAQAMVPCVALDGLDGGDILAWLDADVETLKDIPKGWLDGLAGEYDMACLQRKNKYSEIGFWVVRISGDTREMVEVFANVYESGAVFKLPEQHSGYVFDTALAAFPGLRIRNLNPTNEMWQPWGKSPLAEFTVHHKGGKGR